MRIIFSISSESLDLLAWFALQIASEQEKDPAFTDEVEYDIHAALQRVITNQFVAQANTLTVKDCNGLYKELCRLRKEGK